MSKGLRELEDADVLPLVRCVLAFQMETTSSSSSFHKLEQIVTKLSESKESLVAEEVNKLMSSLTEYKQVLSPGDLQTVCMFIEDSSLGRHHWRLSLAPLLLRVAATLNLVLQDPTAQSEEWSYITVKTCLQLFQAMPKEVSPLVWSEAENSGTLQSILGSLLQVVMGQTANKDARLLAGTAVSMLVNTAAEPERGARAVLTLFQLVDQGPGDLKFGELKVETSVLSSDGLERLVLTRGLLTCCKKEILSCRLDSFPPQACLLLDVLFPAVWAVSEEQKDYHYYRFQVFSLWLQRILECLPEIWKVKESRMLAENSELLHRLSQFIWNNAESPVEGASEFIHSSFQHLLEIYRLECHHFEDLERPLYEQFLQRIMAMPWQVKARYFPLCAILPYVGTEKVLDTYKDLPQHLLNCLATNHLCPAASDVYKTILQQQRKHWMKGEEHATEEQLAQKWALPWLPTLASALTSPISFLQSNASNYLLVWTLRLFPASYALLAESCSGGDSAHLRAWVALLSGRKIITGALPLDGETLERLCWCLHSREESIRLAALGLLCCSPRTNQALSEVEVRLLKEFLPLNLNCDSSSFRQLLQAAVKKALVRLRDSALSQLRSKMPSKATEHSASAAPEGALAQAVDFVEWLLQLSISFLTPGSNYQRKKTALLLLAAVLETCTDTWSPARKKGQPPPLTTLTAYISPSCLSVTTENMAALLSWARRKGCWDFFSRSNLLALLSCLQDSTNEVRELASELLIRYFPPAFPEPIAVALFERAQEAVSSPRVQEAEAGAVLMKTILQKSDSSTLKRLFPEGKAAPALQHRGLCFARYLLSMLQAHYAMACQDLLQAASTNPMHGVMAALRRCLLEVPEGAVSMLKGEHVKSWQELLSRLVALLGDISTFLLGVLQSRQGPNANQAAAAPSFADMINAIGSLIMLGKGLEQQDGEDSILLSEEHNLILTCCWVSVKEIGLLLGGLVEKILPLAPSTGPEPLLPLTVFKMAARVFQEVLLKCRHWVSALHVLQTLVRGSGLGTALLQYVPPMMALLLKALGSSSWAMRNAAIQLFSALTARVLGPKRSREDSCAQDGLAGNPIYAVRVMAAKALVPVVPTAEYGKLLLRLAGDLAKQGSVLSHNTLHGRLLQIRALLAYAADTNCLSADAMLSVAHQLEGQFWLVTPAQQCPLIRSAYLQVISLLVGSCTQGFAKRLREVVSSELDSFRPGQKARSSKLQVGSAVFHQVITHFLCKEAASLAGAERVGAVCLLLQGADVDIQSAILTWVIEGEEERSKDLEKSLQLTLLENLKSVVQGRRDKEFLKLYLEALVHLCRSPSSQTQDVFHKLLGPAAACVDVLLFMVETESPGPDLLFQALSVISLLFVLGVMDMGIYLLQDEDQEVRREASVFASLVQHMSGAQPQDSCVFIQGNRGLVCLLHVLLEKFWGCQDTFEFLLRHLPTLDLSNILTELEANKAVSLYKEDEPNVFAEPAVLSRLLLPFLLQLLDRVPAATRLCDFTQRWLKATGPSILHNLQHCKHWWGRDAITPLHMKALGCAKVHAAVTALLVKATLLAHALDGLERSHISASEIHCTSQELRSELVLVQELLAQHGMAPSFSLDYGITDIRCSRPQERLFHNIFALFNKTGPEVAEPLLLGPGFGTKPSSSPAGTAMPLCTAEGMRESSSDLFLHSQNDGLRLSQGNKLLCKTEVLSDTDKEMAPRTGCPGKSFIHAPGDPQPSDLCLGGAQESVEKRLLGPSKDPPLTCAPVAETHPVPIHKTTSPPSHGAEVPAPGRTPVPLNCSPDFALAYKIKCPLSPVLEWPCLGIISSPVTQSSRTDSPSSEGIHTAMDDNASASVTEDSLPSQRGCVGPAKELRETHSRLHTEILELQKETLQLQKEKILLEKEKLLLEIVKLRRELDT
ncbi:Thyroid adenoma-associated protein like protein [Chelonia mydas]|uniref:Thyroid adenoma-associated protein like protein n=1 Tax=Chelonia mydas TaxID=8469 RepID=M7BQT1_CHEMY|nr:Thyroid adenoma-associated protein like protein [Chelonia mydas]